MDYEKLVHKLEQNEKIIYILGSASNELPDLYVISDNFGENVSKCHVIGLEADIQQRPFEIIINLVTFA
jgi:hypothetical protein